MHVSEKDDEKLSTSDKSLKSTDLFFQIYCEYNINFSIFCSFLDFLAELVFQLKARGQDLKGRRSSDHLNFLLKFRKLKGGSQICPNFLIDTPSVLFQNFDC